MSLIKHISKRAPDLVIGPEENPYMRRWFLKKDTKFADLYLHQICRSDDARALHDHRADNISLVLKGGYTEVIAPKIKDWVNTSSGIPLGFRYDLAHPETHWRGPGSIVYRKAEQPHRLIVNPGECAWTLWFKFAERRDWGFWPNIGTPEDGDQYVWMQWLNYAEKYGEQSEWGDYMKQEGEQLEVPHLPN